MREVSLTIPAWVSKEEAEKEILYSLLSKAWMKLEYYQNKMRLFEKKYGISFIAFRQRVESGKDEQFEEWDDLIEWEAYYRAYAEWKKKYEETSICLHKS